MNFRAHIYMQSTTASSRAKPFFAQLRRFPKHLITKRGPRALLPMIPD